MKKKVVSALTAAAIVSGACASAASASTYTVQKGDSLSLIAFNYHTSIQDLKNANSLTTDIIRINQVLQLPDTAVQPSVQTPPPATVAYYTVVRGDNLSLIASRHGITLAELREWNGLTSDLIFPGQQLKVKNGSGSQPAAVQPQSSAPASTSSYVIQSGDTLGKIAKMFSTTVNNLMQLNGLSSDRIYAGRTLKVSGTAPAAPSAPAAPAPAPAPAPAGNSSTYTVQRGDTLSGIAANFGTTVATIQQLNGLTSTLIFAGQTLKVSGQAAPTPVPTAAKPAAAPASAPSTDSGTPNPQFAASVTLIAKGLLGIPYVWGGGSASGVDCSGLIYYVFNKAGYSIGRYSAAGYADRSFEVSNPVPGDIVFFKNTYKPGISHMGIYLGNNQFVHADETHGVMISNLSNSYYQVHFDSFGRFY